MPKSVEQGSDLAVAGRTWLAFAALCLGVFMVVIDGTALSAALPSIKRDLGFSDTSLVWVVNSYMLTYGSFLLLGGRLADRFGQRRVFLSGIVLFTVASVCCGFAYSKETIIVARAIQGIGGAVAAAVGLALTTTLFAEPKRRAKAMAVYGFVCTAGDGLGVVLGGMLTSAFNWRSIFFINFPIGVATYLVCQLSFYRSASQVSKAGFDVAGAFMLTLALTMAVYALVGIDSSAAPSNRVGLLCAAAAVFGLFLLIEARSSNPLLPLSIFGRNLAASIAAIALWSAAEFAWAFLGTLYLQLVLGFTPQATGFAFFPANVVTGVASLLLSARLVNLFGLRAPSVAGLLMATVGFCLLARMPDFGNFVYDMLPAILLIGLGAGIFGSPLYLAAMSDVAEADTGLASGIASTATLMGGALGLASLTRMADFRASTLLVSGQALRSSLSAGYHLAFGACAVLLGVATVISAVFIKAPLTEAGDSAEGNVAS